MAPLCTTLYFYYIFSTEHRNHNTPSTKKIKHFCTITAAALPVWRMCSFKWFFSFEGFCETIQEVETHGMNLRNTTQKCFFSKSLLVFAGGLNLFARTWIFMVCIWQARIHYLHNMVLVSQYVSLVQCSTCSLFFWMHLIQLGFNPLEKKTNSQIGSFPQFLG